MKNLIVQKVDLNIATNSTYHRTNRFPITEGDNPQLVLRRGQEFTMTVTFDRPYLDDTDDLYFLFDADDEGSPSLSEKLFAKVKVTEDGSSPHARWGEWGATVVKAETGRQTLQLSVYVPGDVVVGEWELRVLTDVRGSGASLKYRHDTPIIILFNPWSAADQVHFTEDKSLLNEYVLNRYGTVYYGSANSIGSKEWRYGQFKKRMLTTCLSILRKAFQFKVTSDMADVVTVSRALSSIINHNDDNGVVVGNWSGDFAGGTNPTTWSSSIAILEQYEKTGRPVKFGQCWVYSHVLTTVCRTLGLPCRNISNFESAHDTNKNCLIEKYFTEHGDEVTIGSGQDSVWNFHVWNEVWMSRPDIPGGDYGGWQVIDATPQEPSAGLYQCGPCPVKAVKEGELQKGFDTTFVYAEVNADRVHWVVDYYKKPIRYTWVDKHGVGRNISTKPPNGRPHKPMSRWNVDSSEVRLDITRDYKYPEGSPEEREVAKKATPQRYLRLLQEGGIKVAFDKVPDAMVGQDVVITSRVRNTSSVDRQVEAKLTVSIKPYWNGPADGRQLAKKEYPATTVGAGRELVLEVNVTAEEYIPGIRDDMHLSCYTSAKDMQDGVTYSDETHVTVDYPDLDVSGPASAYSGQKVAVKVSLTCPCNLTNCLFYMEGDLDVHIDDANDFTHKPRWWEDYGRWFKKIGYLRRDETFQLTLQLKGTLGYRDTDDEKSMTMVLFSEEILAGIRGSYHLQLHQ